MTKTKAERKPHGAVHWRDTLFFGFRDKLTHEQATYLDAIYNSKITFVNARSGSGKTTMAVGAAKLLNQPLVYIFAPVEEDKMGFRPGDQREKEAEYLQPLKDALLEINENPEQAIYDPEIAEKAKNGVDESWVFPMSHIFARGTNIKNCTVIITEAQNFTRGELKKILTRIHDTCTVIVEGHEGQIDLDDPRKSGFLPYMRHFAEEDYVSLVQLTVNFRGEISRKADELTW
jgi:phosphate starvation-inducible protein PhoH and related proteins